MDTISIYRITIPAQAGGRPAAIETLLCVACASREDHPHQLVRPAPGRRCVRCGLDGSALHAIRIADIRVGLERATQTARAQLAGQTLWLDDLEAAYTWLVAFDQPILTDGHIVLLPSDSTGQIYSVNGSCQCPAYERRANRRHDRACKHRLRARLFRLALAAQQELLAAAATTRSRCTPRPAIAALAAAGRSAQEEADELFPD